MTEDKVQNLEKKDLQHQLQNAVQMAIATNQTLFTIPSVFWVANAVLLGGLLHVGISDRFIAIIVSLVGVVTSFAWHAMESSVLWHLESRYEQLIKELEKKLQLGDCGLFNDNYFEERPKATRVRQVVIPWFSLGATIAWGISLISFIVITVVG